MKRYILISFSILFLVIGCSRNKELARPKTAQNPIVDLKDATQLLAQKRCAEAVQAYQKFLQKYPKDSGGWNSIGLAYLCNSQPQEALAAFKQALVLTPTYTDVHNNLGVTYMELKNYPEASNEFKKALEDPVYPKAGPYFNLAKLAYMQGSYEEARALAKKVITFLPNEAAPRLLYSMCLEKLNRLDEAATSYRELLKAAPTNLEATYHMGTVLMLKSQDCEAQQYFNKVVDADPLSDLGQKSLAALKNLRCSRSKS